LGVWDRGSSGVSHDDNSVISGIIHVAPPPMTRTHSEPHTHTHTHAHSNSNSNGNDSITISTIPLPQPSSSPVSSSTLTMTGINASMRPSTPSISVNEPSLALGDDNNTNTNNRGGSGGNDGSTRTDSPVRGGSSSNAPTLGLRRSSSVAAGALAALPERTSTGMIHVNSDPSSLSSSTLGIYNNRSLAAAVVRSSSPSPITNAAAALAIGRAGSPSRPHTPPHHTLSSKAHDLLYGGHKRELGKGKIFDVLGVSPQEMQRLGTAPPAVDQHGHLRHIPNSVLHRPHTPPPPIDTSNTSTGGSTWSGGASSNDPSMSPVPVPPSTAPPPHLHNHHIHANISLHHNPSALRSGHHRMPSNTMTISSSSSSSSAMSSSSSSAPPPVPSIVSASISSSSSSSVTATTISATATSMQPSPPSIQSPRGGLTSPRRSTMPLLLSTANHVTSNSNESSSHTSGVDTSPDLNRTSSLHNKKVQQLLYGRVNGPKENDTLGVTQQEIDMFGDKPKAYQTLGMFDSQSPRHHRDHTSVDTVNNSPRTHSHATASSLSSNGGMASPRRAMNGNGNVTGQSMDEKLGHQSPRLSMSKKAEDVLLGGMKSHHSKVLDKLGMTQRELDTFQPQPKAYQQLGMYYRPYPQFISLPSTSQIFVQRGSIDRLFTNN
jgi:hypothetical protein